MFEEPITINLLNRLPTVYFKFKNSNAGIMKCENIKYLAIKIKERYRLVNQETLFDHLSEEDKAKLMFYMDELEDCFDLKQSEMSRYYIEPSYDRSNEYVFAIRYKGEQGF